MLSRRGLFSFAAVLLMAAFCLGLTHLLVLRYSTGDAFPHYSSLRADPLGTKVFYESLRALPGMTVSRNERPLRWFGEAGEGTTLMLLGARDGDVPDPTRDALERFVQSGGRLVLAFYPRYAPRVRKSASPSPTATASATPAEQPEATPAASSFHEVLKRWGVGIAEDRDAEDNVAKRTPELPLEEQLGWHSGVVFQPQHADWRVIYERQRGPVVVDRSFGRGSVVLASDSYFVSNEALLTQRAPALLSWLAGGGAGRHIVFDESHLDVREQPGVATLLRRYGLSGSVIGFLVLIVLWLWRNATFSLAPRSATTQTDEVVSGRDSFTGFVHLLRRGIAPGELVRVCVAEWNKSSGAVDKAKLPEDAGTAATANAVAVYNEISTRVGSKKWKTTQRS